MFTHLCGAGLALLAFAASLIIGLYVDNPFTTVVTRSLVVLVFFYVLGCALSALGQKVVQENFDNEFKNDSQNNENEDDKITNNNQQTSSNQPVTAG